MCLCVAALASLGYEKTCVLFNAAALASQIASEQNLDNDEGLKAAAKYYQVGVPTRRYTAQFGVKHLMRSSVMMSVMSRFAMCSYHYRNLFDLYDASLHYLNISQVEETCL